MTTWALNPQTPRKGLFKEAWKARKGANSSRIVVFRLEPPLNDTLRVKRPQAAHARIPRKVLLKGSLGVV